MKLERITYNPDPLSHHSEYIQQFITQGIKIDGVHYFIEEYLIEDNKLFAIVSSDKRTFYKYLIHTSSDKNSDSSSSEPFNKDEFKDEVLDFVHWNPYSTFEHGILALNSDNSFFGFTNYDPYANIELSFYHNKHIIDTVLLQPSDFVNNKKFENDRMIYGLSVSNFISDMIGGHDIEDHSGKGQLRVQVTLKQPFNSVKETYAVVIKYYKYNNTPSVFLYQRNNLFKPALTSVE